MQELLLYFFFTIGILSSIGLILFFLFQKKSFYYFLAKGFFGKGLVNSSKKLANELPSKVKKETLGEVAGEGIVRLTRIGIYAIIIGLLPTILLFQQNNLIAIQNDRFAEQNKRIEQQTYLIEADRRSSYNFRLNNVFDRIDLEIREQKEELQKKGLPKDSLKFNLSKSLISRIAALSFAFKPYRYLDNDSLIPEPLSPERGQLLIVLGNSDISAKSARELNARTNFEFSEAKEFTLMEANLNYLRAKGSDMRGASFALSDLLGANFNGANLRRANFLATSLVNVDFRDADLTNAFFVGADLSGTKWNNPKLRNADLRQVSMLNKVSLANGDLRNTNFSKAGLGGVDFKNADLSHANLSETVLIFTDFRGANLFNVDLTNADLTASKIDFEELMKVSCLSGAKGLSEEWQNKLMRLKPELF